MSDRLTRYAHRRYASDEFDALLRRLDEIEPVPRDTPTPR